MLIIAHRGDKNSGLAENSLSAILLAKKNGYDGIEFDVRASKDRKFYLLHDITLGRTTDMKGPISSKISDMLNRCHLRNGEQLPLLEDVLKALKGYKGTVFAELKCKSLEDEFMKILGKYRLKFIIASYSFRSLERMRQIDAKAGFHLDQLFLTRHSVRKAKSLRCYSIGSPIHTMRKSIVAYAKKHRLKVMPYMISSEKMLSKAKRLDVDGIFADGYY